MNGPRRRIGAALAAVLLLTGCGEGFDDSPRQQTSGSATLQVLLGSATSVELEATRAIMQTWAQRTGNRVNVVASADLPQQLGQGFAGGTPPDLFVLEPGAFSRYAQPGALHAYADRLPGADDIYPNLRSIFTHEGKFVCAPKDFSTLALVIDTEAWAAAGLTDADLPRDWAQLEAVAKRLTTPRRKGLVLMDDVDRIGAFFKQAGGWLVDPSGKKATVDSPQNLQALQYVQRLLRSGSTAFAKQIDSGWSGEALGKGSAAMVVEGNWVIGALAKDYPQRKWRAVELPAGPAGKGTLAFTNCWGVPTVSKNRQAAESLVAHLTDVSQQNALGEGFGVIPSRKLAATLFARSHPEQQAFLAGADYAQGEPTAKGLESVLKDFDAQLLGLTGGADPKAILASTQRNAEQVLGR
ncbi:sugar ABC transporter substrate-binding protein [Allokutzneria albata]|uniref:Carbohydrate ABC transporter substrate-binding protein, CUT1 family n=1 Tax=Allokutzneria albata TaxID=211114 RepID=A0A1H0CEI4_ALLAB|nr:extracellular solute-binding protein [Allokutzneria albata]SDN56328.1 carbohydrate ABC transporter substrate-binding protein, CUT1 family [Allokutzneria albata]